MPFGIGVHNQAANCAYGHTTDHHHQGNQQHQRFVRYVDVWVYDAADLVEVERAIYGDENKREERHKQNHKDLVCLVIDKRWYRLVHLAVSSI